MTLEEQPRIKIKQPVLIDEEKKDHNQQEAPASS